MRLLLALLLVLPALAQGKPDKAKDAKKKAQEEAENKELEEKQRIEAPGYYRWYDPLSIGMLKVNLIDTSEAPKLKVFVSVLRGSKSGILEAEGDWEEQVREVGILLGEGKLQKNPLVVIEKGVVTGGGGDEDGATPPEAKILPLDKAKIGLDIVVVAAGHGGFKDPTTLDTRHQAAVSGLLRKLGGAGSNINLVWAGPTLFTYRSFAGMENDLSRFDEAQSQCEIDRLRWRMAQGIELEEGEEAPPAPPCGLHEGGGKTIAGLVDKMRMRGKHSRLFGITRDGINACTDDTAASTALRFYDVEDLEQKTTDAGGFEEALRLLLTYGKPGNRKAIVIIGDGVDGFIEDDATCRRFFTSSKKCSEPAKELRGDAARKKIQDCVSSELGKRNTTFQRRFQARAANWIALLRAADIRVFSLGYAMVRPDGTAVSQQFERERLELLSLKTGGTYREVWKPAQVEEAATALADEILRERVILVNAGLKSEAEYKLKMWVKIGVVQPFAPSDGTTFEFQAPLIESGWWHWVKKKSAALKKKVGTILWWVIVIAAGLFLLFILYLFLKLMKAAVMKVVKAFAKKGADAAKGVGKAAQGAAKGAAKGAGKAAKGGK